MERVDRAEVRAHDVERERILVIFVAVPAIPVLRQVVGVDPAIGAALFDKAPGAAAMVDIDALTGIERIDDAIAGAGTGADVDGTGGKGGGRR